MWKRLPDLPFNVVNHQTVIIDNLIYVIGGYKNSEALNYEKISIFIISKNHHCVKLNTCQTYSWNCKNDHFIEYLSNSLEPNDCYGHTVVKWREVAILFGGCHTNSQSGYSASKIYLFVPNDMCLPKQLKCSRDYKIINYWIIVNGIGGTAPIQRDGHSSVIVHDQMFLFGGLLGSEVKYFDNKLYQLDLISWQWTVIYNGDYIEPLGRDFCTLMTHRNCLYLFGGRSDDNLKELTNNDMYDTAMWKFDLATNRDNRWTKIYPGYGIISNSSLITNENDNVNNHSHISKYTRCPLPRRSHMAVMFQDDILVFGGLYETDSFSAHFNDLWSFNVSSCQWTLLSHKTSSNFRIEKPPNLRRGSLTQISDNYALLIGGVTSIENPEISHEKIIGHSLTITPNIQSCATKYHTVNRLAAAHSFNANQIILYQKSQTNFSGTITMINDLSLKSLNRVFILQPQLSLYQRALFIVSNIYTINQLKQHFVPYKVISDIEDALIFER